MVATAYNESIKYTTVLPKTCIDELKYLADKKIIPSVSHAIRVAVENFIEVQKQQEYAGLMREAAKDENFIKRTMDTQEEFSAIDAEGVLAW
jgi:metal-responsive CopG/Arc/MetJ family transcriptional regulator